MEGFLVKRAGFFNKNIRLFSNNSNLARIGGAMNRAIEYQETKWDNMENNLNYRLGD